MRKPRKLLTAEAILRQTARAYAGCRAYEDAGVVRVVFIHPDSRRIVKRPFRTAFIRPHRFRYEFRKGKWDAGKDRYIVWSDGKTIKTWWDTEGRNETLKSLRMAIASATGVSGGSAHVVASLLLPKKIGWGPITNLKHPTRIRDGRVNGVQCFRVQGEVGDVPTQVWLDKATFLIRKILPCYEFKNFRTEHSIIFFPKMGTKIRDDLLQFNPPTANYANHAKKEAD